MINELPKRELSQPVSNDEQSVNASSETHHNIKSSSKKRKKDLKAHRQRTQQLKYLKGYEDQVLRLAIALNELPEDSREQTETMALSAEPSTSEHSPIETIYAEIADIEPAILSSPETESLVDASIKTVDVINLFQDIANRINLFALKSTLEAARHGGTNSSFSHMAVELKDLAQQTSLASNKLYAYMSSIQKTLSNTTQAMLDGHINQETSAGLSWKKISGRIAQTVQHEDIAEQALTEQVFSHSEDDLDLLADQLTESLNAIKSNKKGA